MKKVRNAFELYEGNVEYIPPGYQEVSCHIIFDVKMVENLICKDRMVVGGNNTTTPYSLTYFSVVSQDSVMISLTINALSNLKFLVCNIQNAYLSAKL